MGGLVRGEVFLGVVADVDQHGPTLYRITWRRSSLDLSVVPCCRPAPDVETPVAVPARTFTARSLFEERCAPAKFGDRPMDGSTRLGGGRETAAALEFGDHLVLGHALGPGRF